MDFGLHGKVAIVTGGSDGIGRATAERLVAEGAYVVICARGEEKLASTLAVLQAKGKASAVVADVTKAGDCRHIVHETVREFGGVDILVNNAGVSSRGPLEAVTDEDWHRDLDLKLFAAVRLARGCVPEMRKRGGGRIVNVTTIGGKQPDAESMPSSVTRAAGLGMTKALSKELAKDNILVNTVCIGLVRAGQHERKAAKAGISAEQLYASMASQIPLGRVGEASEVANAITFFASTAASYITGSSLNLDGGTSGVL